MLKEPAFLIYSASIPVYNISQWIQLKQYPELRIIFEHTDIPEDRGSPHSYLKSDINDLRQITEKHHNRTGTIAHGQHQYKQAEAVIKDLQGIQIGHISIHHCNNQ